MGTNKIIKMTLRKTVEDDEMLDRLKDELGINTKARALLFSAHAYLNLIQDYKVLESKYDILESQNEQIKDAIRSKRIADNHLRSLAEQ